MDFTAHFDRSQRADSRRLQDGSSFSGHERNHLFLNLRGTEFVDVSGVSGLDDDADGRSFALLDFDRDGWQDVALVNANKPLFELYHNRAAKLTGGATGPNRMLALRFVGANRSAQPMPGKTNRDGLGAVVELQLGALKLMREHRAGDGFGAQNSATLIVGIGERDAVDSLTVRWPSGVVQEMRDVPANQLVTLYEDPAHSPLGTPFALEPYRVTGVAGSQLVSPH